MRKLYKFFIWTSNFIIYKLWWVLNAFRAIPVLLHPSLSRFLSELQRSVSPLHPHSQSPLIRLATALREGRNGGGASRGPPHIHPLPSSEGALLCSGCRAPDMRSCPGEDCLPPLSLSQGAFHKHVSLISKKKSIYLDAVFSLVWLQLFVFLYLNTCLQ